MKKIQRLVGLDVHKDTTVIAGADEGPDEGHIFVPALFNLNP